MITSSQFAQRLLRRGREAGISVSPAVIPPLENYFRLLTTWNQKINLTALPLVEPTAETFDRLLVEPLVAVSFVPHSALSMLDIGSGGGSPAIPMAVGAPSLRLTMLEAKVRKSVFLREAIRIVGLPSAEVLTARLEDIGNRQEITATFDVITVRAVRVDESLVRSFTRLLRPHGQIFLFGYGSNDIPATLDGLSISSVHTLPGGRDNQLTLLSQS